MRLYTHYIVKRKDWHHLVYLAVGVALVAGGVTGYWWYARYRAQEAHGQLMSVKAAIDGVQRDAASSTLNNLARQCEDAYQRHKGTSYAPYFLVYRAEVALLQGDNVTARDMLGSAVEALPSGTILRDYIRVKRAVIAYDMDTQEAREIAEQELKRLAGDPQNAARDMARYYYGLGYFVRGDRAQADAVWNEMRFEGQDDPSPWAYLADLKRSYRM